MANLTLNIEWVVSDVSGNVPGTDWFDFTNAGNSPKEILSCVHCLLNTAIGSVALDRSIGVDYSFVDKPQPLAMSQILAEIPGKIRKYEPRCSLTDVIFAGTQSELESGKIRGLVKVTIPAVAG